MQVHIRRDDVTAFILHYSATHGGNSPSMQEIADGLHISKSAVNLHLMRLIQAGEAMREDGKFWLLQAHQQAIQSDHG